MTADDNDNVERPSPERSDVMEHHHHHHPIVIVGGGIGGLVLALCLDQAYNHPEEEDTIENVEDDDPASSIAQVSSSPPKHRSRHRHQPRLPVHVYESASAYTANAGGAIGLYPNGLRVLRHLSRTHPHLANVLSDVRSAGCEYLYRRWMRHDGTEVAVAREDELLPDVVGGSGDEEEGEGGEIISQKVSSGLDDSERSAASDGMGGSTAESSSTGSPRRGGRPRGDSIDSEGSRADRRPRGGSFGGLKDGLKRMGLSRIPSGYEGGGDSADCQQPRDRGGSFSSSSAADQVEGGVRPSSRISFNGLRVVLQDLTTAGAGFSGDNTRASAISSNPSPSHIAEKELLSLGIRRWKYQQVLQRACQAAGIHIHLGKRLVGVESLPPSKDHDEDDGGGAKTLLTFKDGTTITASLLIGADGINSRVRDYVRDPAPTTTTKDDDGAAAQQKEEATYVPEYTGVTCLMGCANVPRPVRGICFPTSATTRCHACYYPTRAPDESNGDDPDDYEQVFQIYFPSPVERPDTWRTLSPMEAREECATLARRLREDGWDEGFLTPLESPTLTGVLRVGLRSREGLDTWHVGGGGGDDREGDAAKVGGDDGVGAKAEAVGRAVLLGDAAHPPLPYIGQGAMMAMEDAGTLSMVLAHYCPIVAVAGKGNDSDDGPAAEVARPDLSRFSSAMETYESLRVSRTKAILGSSVHLGKTQQKRAESKLYNAWREISIKAQVWAYGTLPVMRPGAAFDCRAAAAEALLRMEEEDDAESGGDAEQQQGAGDGIGVEA